MVDKYIRHGETYCGDGTTSAAATSNGGVGAWNNINVLTGTAPAYGTLAAGDNVYIRSKDAANANISVTSATAITVGSAAATEASPVTWIIDAGSIWSGVSGTVTVSTTAGAVGITNRAYNNLIASNYNLIFSNTVSSFGNATFFTMNTCLTKDIKIDTSANTTSTGSNHQFNGGKHINLWLKHGTVTYSVIQFSTRSFDVCFISPKLEIIGPCYLAVNTTAIFESVDGVNSCVSIYGGEIVSAINGLLIYKTGMLPFSLSLFGLKYPQIISISNETLFTQKIYVTANGNDGALGNTYFDYFYTYSSRFDGYYPTLNANLETSANTAWSYSIYPYRTTKLNPAQVSVSKLWTQAAATKTVTLEFLWPTSLASPDSTSVWMTIQYTDASTGNKVSQTTLSYPAASISSSSAAWSSTTYGPTLFNKYKLSLTTQSNIKQDTEIVVSFFSVPKSVSANDIIMLCPDVVLS